MNDREQHAIRLIQMALASMEMRNERAFDLKVPRQWIQAAHELCYEEHADTVMNNRLEAARKRNPGQQLATAVHMLTSQ